MGRDRSAPAPTGQRIGPTDGGRRDLADLAAASRHAWRRLLGAPRPMVTEHRQAAHELGLAVSLVLTQPQAARSLEQLANSHRIHPEGALVLGALLQATGHREAAQFWWEFAAGAGSYTAASCLNLLHRSRGELDDADLWRDRAAAMAEESRPAAAPVAADGSLLPAHVRDEIIARCHEGLDIHLPSRIAAVIHQLPVAVDDEDYGEVPQPDPALLPRLAAAGAAHPAPDSARPDEPILWYYRHRHPSGDTPAVTRNPCGRRVTGGSPGPPGGG
ncbi:hypothetical protein ACFV4P_27400 [Kitasatospora sp. NPDC059795]|uniref:hypothetical protein n=1 Tax=Kitasatospora sp. NPDC059795 TaxID=3346949 RepID=UPI00364DE05D